MKYYFYILSSLLLSHSFLASQDNNSQVRKLTGPEKQKMFLKKIWGDTVLTQNDLQRMRVSINNLSKNKNSLREENKWNNIGPNAAFHNKSFFHPNSKIENVTGRIRDIAVDVLPEDNYDTGIRILAATGGIYGVWEIPIGNGLSVLGNFHLTKTLPSTHFTSFAFHSLKKGLILVGSGETGITCGQGLWRTEDNGITWSNIAMDHIDKYPCLIHKIFFDPILPFVVHAATSNGYMRSDDEGLSWKRTSDNIDMTGLVKDKNSWSILYCIGGNGQLYISQDNGDNWKPITSNLPLNNSFHAALGIDPIYSNRIYVNLVGKNNLTHGLYKSTDNGSTFSTCTFEGKLMPDMHWGQGYYNNVVEVSPLDNNVVFAAGGAFLRSTNTTDYFGIDAHHADHHAIVFDKKGVMYIGTDGGLYVSYDNGLNFSAKYNIFPTMQFYHAGISRANPNFIAGGTQDNGTIYHNNEGWFSLLNGDGTSGSVNHDIPEYMYGSDNGGYTRYSKNGGLSWQTDFNLCPGKYITYEHEKSNVVSTANPLLAFCERKVYRETRTGWQDITSRPMEGNILYMTASNKNSTASNPNIYLTVLHNNPIHRLAIKRRESSSWSVAEHSNGLPDDTYVRVFPHPFKFDVAYALCTGIPMSGLSQKLFKTENAGLDWVNITGNLPNLPLTCLTVHPKNDNIIVVGTAGFGFLESVDGGNTWHEYNEGTAISTIVTGLDIIDSTYTNGKVHLIAYTYGHSFMQREWPNVFVSENQNFQSSNYREVELIHCKSKGFYQLHFTNYKQEKVKINVCSVQGQVLRSQVEELQEGATDLELNLNELSQGIYLIQIVYSDHKISTSKVILN